MDTNNNANSNNNYNYGGQFAAGNVPPLAPKKKSHTGLIVFLVLLILAAGGAAAGYWYMNQNEQVNDELQAYERLENSEVLADYEMFMARYPESNYMRIVKERYEELRKMYEQWHAICTSDNQRDYELFMRNYPKSSLTTLCTMKIDSLDWMAAKDAGQEAIQDYLIKHPNGRYFDEARKAESKLLDAQATAEEKLMVEEVLNGFFTAYGNNNPEMVLSYIAPTMTRFLSRTNATKADVLDIIDRTYNEHILSCRFVTNNDFSVTKIPDEVNGASYKVTFSVDQYISRDDEGKTFGGYAAEATINPQYKISSLTMKETSRR